jgi:hypothetical protein
MADMASRSFGSTKKWHCKSDADFACIFNSLFPLPNKNIWTVFHPTREISMRVISVLRMRDSTLDEWRRIPKIGQFIGKIGAPMSNLWEWIRTSNNPLTQRGHAFSQDLPPKTESASTDEADKLKLQQYLQLSRPLARRSHWNVRETH